MTRILPTALLLAACASGPALQGEERVDVRYVAPERFADAGRGYGRGGPADAGILEELRRHIVQRAAPRLGEGKRLTVAITDLDLAGEIEPWRARLYDVRIVRGVYPPTIDLRFELVGADGTVLQSGERKLRDLAFQLSVNRYGDRDRLRYEKALIDGWLERAFPTPVNALRWDR